MTETGDPRHGNGTVRPDPTVLTTQLVDRAISAFREVMETRLGGMDTATELVAERVAQLPSATSAAHDHLRADFDRDLAAIRELIQSHREQFAERIGAMDKATELLAENVRQVPTDIDKAARALREILAGEIRSVSSVTAEEFKGVKAQFESNALALTAALSAAEKAVFTQNEGNNQAIAKSEVATQKQIDAMVQLMTTSNKSLEDKITDLRTRLDRGEGSTTGAAETRTERRLDTGVLVGIAGVVVAIITIVVVIILSGHSAG